MKNVEKFEIIAFVYFLIHYGFFCLKYTTEGNSQ